MQQITTVGKYKIGDVDCEVKVADHGDYVIVYSTEAGHDVPISGSQVKINKDLEA